MSTLTVTAKGQITLRKDILQHLGVQAGAKVSVHKLPNGRLEVSAEKPKGKISEAFGMLVPWDKKSLTIEEMNDVIAAGWAGEP